MNKLICLMNLIFLLILCNYYLLFNQMKQPKEKMGERPLRLPQINNKTSSSFSTEETSNSRVRPSSSSKLNDLEKNLFTQLSQYDNVGKKDSRKTKTKKQIQSQSTNLKQVTTQWLDLEAPYLKKLEKAMPQAYMKLIQSKKSDVLQQTNKSKVKKPTSIEAKTQSQVKPKSQKQSSTISTSNKQEKRQSSFAVAQREVQQIFKQYLEEQGLQDFPQAKNQDLTQLKKEMSITETNLNNLKKSMYEIIQKLSTDCINFNVQ